MKSITSMKLMVVAKAARSIVPSRSSFTKFIRESQSSKLIHFSEAAIKKSDPQVALTQKWLVLVIFSMKLDYKLSKWELDVIEKLYQKHLKILRMEKKDSF